MIILDTNVVSEPLKAIPSEKVIDWLDQQSAETLYITAVTRAELRYGVLGLPKGRRKASRSSGCLHCGMRAGARFRGGYAERE
ncbi:MAG: hypothetical protein OHK0021_19710 [Bryobacter sp.]